jgi:hypothetical protein
MNKEKLQMKKQWIVLWIVALTIPVLAQQTNNVRKATPENKKREQTQTTEQQRKERSVRKYKFLEKSLSELGVSKEDRVKIRDLQIEHRKKMKANMQRMNKARKTLSRLESSTADDAEIEQAIQEIAQAQAEQLRILVGNRREMESILGKEKYAHFMENARAQYRKHDNRSGAGIPPRPGLPPLPNPNSKHKSAPPSPIEKYLQFMDHARKQFFEKREARGAPPPTPEEYIRFVDRSRKRFFENQHPSEPHSPQTP